MVVHVIGMSEFRGAGEDYIIREMGRSAEATRREREHLDRFEHDAPSMSPKALGLGSIVWADIPTGPQRVVARYLVREPKPWTWAWIKREINRTLCRWFGHAPWEVERCGCGEDGEDGMGRECPRCGEWE